MTVCRFVGEPLLLSLWDQQLVKHVEGEFFSFAAGVNVVFEQGLGSYDVCSTMAEQLCIFSEVESVALHFSGGYEVDIDGLYCCFCFLNYCFLYFPVKQNISSTAGSSTDFYWRSGAVLQCHDKLMCIARNVSCSGTSLL
ncbi:hypothetical protein TTRE_0000873001 [Trichuris trichiura]|uniref:Uncharacterized protein n=1 Tax=Trichuris trichiura TaxID=36087 RepID=A0A077ZNT7_TRITR|nr:hypothetical protein TTRE_0000873001 [Trichuris trichiura]